MSADLGAVSVETRLREEIDRLRFQLTCRDELIADYRDRAAREHPSPLDGVKQPRCVYCGDPCTGRACCAHTDLLEVDVEAAA